MHRVRVRNRASVGDRRRRQACSGPLSVHAYRRATGYSAPRSHSATGDHASTSHPLESVKQIIRLEGPAVTAISAIAACPHPGLPSRCARFLWSADFLQCGGVVNNGQRFFQTLLSRASQDDGQLCRMHHPTAFYGWCIRYMSCIHF
ncbi:hypothetical protein EVAR_98503_1 [Eumeta japonica]|uniref:Uncharacterized protein n=1 Tax=Eumeta variegata TaxID=151549 RepID=A0A4C2AHC2_EUMVA|nr:hypothetical protein EVAR_98503_1 [Eumeta japonica]